MSAANDNSLDLPIEIVSTIIHLLRRDSESLGKCCLVSQTWCSIARSLLWAAELRLFIGYPAKWNERLETHPLIERYISSLCLVGDGPPPRTFSESCAILLARFHHIDKLCIQAFIWGPQEQSMIESLDTSTVRELTLDRIRLTPQDFVHVMKRFPMLSSLRLLGCFIETEHSGSMISTVERVLSLHISEQPVRLEHLTLAVPTSLAFPCLMWLASPRGVDLSLTRTFALSWNITQVGNHSEFRDTFRSVEMRDAYIHFEKLLRRVSPAIRSLALLPCQTADNVENDPWLSMLIEAAASQPLQFQELRTLYIRGSIREASVMSPLLVVNVLPRLQAPHLEHLLISVTFLTHSKMAYSSMSDMLELKTLDDVLSGPAFPRLRRVTVGYRVPGRIFKKPINQFKKCVPKLVATKRLHFIPFPNTRHDSDWEADWWRDHVDQLRRA